MTDLRLEKLLMELATEDHVAAERSFGDPTRLDRWPTPQCVTLPLLALAAEGHNLPLEYQAHLDSGCSYCQAGFEKLKNPQAFDWDALDELAAEFVDLPHADGVTMPSEIFYRLNVRFPASGPVVFRSSGNDPTQPPPKTIRFALLPDGEPISLPLPLVERYYTPVVKNPTFTLILFAADGGYLPAVQMTPAPNRGEPARLTLALPDDSTREFVVPSGPPNSRQSTTSASGELLPAAVFDALSVGWRGTLELR